MPLKKLKKIKILKKKKIYQKKNADIKEKEDLDKKEIANNAGYRRRFYDRKKNKFEIEIEPQKDKEIENIIIFQEDIDIKHSKIRKKMKKKLKKKK